MKTLNNIILPIGLLLMMITSCDKTNSTDEPAFNTAKLPVDLEATEIQDFQASVNVALSELGTVVYSFRTAAQDAPENSRELFDNGTRLDFDEASTQPLTFPGLESNTSYVLYASSVNSSQALNPAVFSLGLTTTDSADPAFLPASSAPAHQTGEIDPFTDEIILTFSETVFYQGGDVTLTGFFTGVTIVLGPDEFVSDGSTEVVFSNDVVFPEDDFMVTTFPEGVFTDNADKPVAALTGFDYIFRTRFYTLAENVQLFLSGEYNFEITDNAGAVPVVPDGSYTVVADGTEITVINGVARGVGVATNEHSLTVAEDTDGDGIGFLVMNNNPQQSIYSLGATQLFWMPSFFLNLGEFIAGPPNVVGFYDFGTGEFLYHLDFSDEFGIEDPANPGFFNPNYLGDYIYEFSPSSDDFTDGVAGVANMEGRTRLMNHPLVQQWLQAIQEHSNDYAPVIQSSSGELEIRN